MKTRLLFAVSLVMSCGLFADHYWTGRGSTSDWTDEGNWINALSDGNTVFGGAKIGDLPDAGSFPTFSSLYTSGKRLWIENNINSKPGVTFDVSEGASADAGWTTTDAGDPTWTIGTGNGGQLTISGGTYTLPRSLHIATGAQDSSLAVEDGTLNVANQFRISTSSGTGTLTMNGGTINCTLAKGDGLAIGTNGTGVFNMHGGTLNCATGFYLAQDSGSGTLNMTGGKINVTGGNNVVIARGWNQDVTSALNLTGGEIESAVTVQAGVGRHSGKADIYMDNGAKFTIGNELVLGNANTHTSVGITNGLLKVAKNIYLGSNGSSTADVTIEDGEFSSQEGRICVADYGTASLTVNGGYVTWGEQLMVGFRANSTGTLIINGGRVESPSHLFQVGLNGKGTYEQNGGSVICGNFRLGTDSATGDGTVTLNGGSFEMEYVTVGSGTGALVLNGGTLRAAKDHAEFIPQNDKLTVKLGAGGAAFDTNGHNITVPALLSNNTEDSDLAGNAPIAKTGLGTLTLSSNLDLARTFKFTIDDEIGPIALAGENNTLPETAEIAVVIDPVHVEPGVSYTVLTGLNDGVTMDDIALSSANDLYACTGVITDGSLSVTVATTAAVSARYVDGKWCFYDAEGNLITDGEAADITTFFFTGNEPEGAIASTIAEGHAVVLEAKLQGGEPVTNTFTFASSLETGRITTDIDAGCAVKLVGQGDVTFAPERFSFAGTLIFASEGEGAELTIARDLTSTTAGRVVFDAGTVNFDGAIDQELEVNGKLIRRVDWTPSIYFFGLGEIEITNAKLTIKSFSDLQKSGTEFFQGYQGALTIGPGAILEDLTELHGEGWKNAYGCPDYFLGKGTLLRMAGGTISRFGDRTNNEQIMNVEVVDGTTNIWNNYQSRSGWTGCNVNVDGTITGKGTLYLRSGGRGYRLNTDLAEFGGTLILAGETITFKNNVNGAGGAVVIAEGGAVVAKNADPVEITNGTLVMKGEHGQRVDGNGNIWCSGDYIINNSTLGVADGLTVHSLTFNEGSSIQLMDEGALADKKTDYLAFTSATPVTLTKKVPAVVNGSSARGTWYLWQEEIPATMDEEGNEVTAASYKIWAKFRPSGFMVIIR